MISQRRVGLQYLQETRTRSRTRAVIDAALGFAVILWLAGRSCETDPRRAIVGGMFAVSTIILILSLYGVLSNVISAWGWIAVICEGLLSIGFGYFLFMKREMDE